MPEASVALPRRHRHRPRLGARRRATSSLRRRGVAASRACSLAVPRARSPRAPPLNLAAGYYASGLVPSTQPRRHSPPRLFTRRFASRRRRNGVSWKRLHEVATDVITRTPERERPWHVIRWSRYAAIDSLIVCIQCSSYVFWYDCYVI